MSLVNREPFNTTINKKLNVLFVKLASSTRINKSKLVDEAIEDLLKKYNIDISELGLDKVQEEA